MTDIRTAEMTKVVENTFRAVNIAFANELAKICRYDHMDVYEIIRICNMHPRVNILQPGGRCAEPRSVYAVWLFALRGDKTAAHGSHSAGGFSALAVHRTVPVAVPTRLV